MKIRVVSEAPPGEWIRVVLVAKDQRAKLQPPPTDGEFSGAVGALLPDRAAGVLYVGLGERSQLDASVVRRALASAALQLRKQGRRRVWVVLEGRPELAGAAVEGVSLGGYRYEEFSPRKTQAFQELVLQVGREDVVATKRLAVRGAALADAVNASRDVANTPGNLLYPETLAARASKMAKQFGLKCRVLSEASLKAGRFGGILAVGGGSVRGPRLIALEHLRGPKGEAPLVLVGKAITFDTGGISIKPAANMEEMIFDKCGATAVLGAMQAVAALGVKRNVVGILAAAENMPSGTAYRPGDVVTMLSGTTVEVVNTDAEGRMVLGDALTWACTHYKAGRILNLATLTGACGIALGDAAAGLWSNDEGWSEAVQQAAAQAGERVWRMPLFPEYSEQIKSRVAAVKNSGGRLGGACTAAAFLKEFVGSTPWAHLDIAYTSHQSKDRNGLAAGATGYGVRMLALLAAQGGRP